MAKRFGLTYDERLRGRGAFDRAFELRASASDDRLVVYALPNELPICRLGVRVGRRFGNSARRNRFKRLMREAFRLNKHKLPAGFDLVVTPRPAKSDAAGKPGSGKPGSGKTSKAKGKSNKTKGESAATAVPTTTQPPEPPPPPRIVLADVAGAFIDLALAAVHRAQRKPRPKPAEPPA